MASAAFSGSCAAHRLGATTSALSQRCHSGALVHRSMALLSTFLQLQVAGYRPGMSAHEHETRSNNLYFLPVMQAPLAGASVRAHFGCVQL